MVGLESLSREYEWRLTLGSRLHPPVSAGWPPFNQRSGRKPLIENEGRVPTKELLGEVLSLDQFDEALLLLKRQHPKREAIRVAIKYC